MGVYKNSDLNDLADQVSDFINDSSEGCQTEPRLDDVAGPVIFKPTLSAFNNGWQAIRDAMDAWASANNGDTPCGPLTWEHPPNLNGTTIWKQETIDEIQSNLDILRACECCCEADEEGGGTFEILASGPIRAEPNTYVEVPGEVNFLHVVVGHAFSVPLFQTAGGTLVSDLMTPTPGKLEEDWTLAIEVHNTDTDEWESAFITNNCECGSCGSTGTAEVPFNGVYDNRGSLPASHDDWRLTMIHGTRDEKCDECSDHPKTICSGGG